MKDFDNPALSVLGKNRNLEDISADEKRIFARYTGSMITRGDWWRRVSEKAVTDAIENVSEKYFNLIRDGPANEQIRKIIYGRGVALRKEPL